MSETASCPTCGIELPVDRGYVTWCHGCGWNLAAPEPSVAPSRVDRIYEKAGKRLGEGLARSLVERDRLEPRFTPARVAAIAVAVFVLLLFVAMVVGAVLLVVGFYWNGFADLAAFMLLGSAFLMRPRFGRRPDEGVVSRAEAPELHRLADEVADALPAKRPDLIVVDHDFNASWSVVGISRTRVLTLGLPLLSVLSPQQRVALVAHELAHARNGDASRGFLVGSAVRALRELYRVLAPDWRRSVRGGLFAGLGPLVAALMWLVSRPVWLSLILETHLLLRDSQRAEYFADLLSAEVAGAEAAVGLQERLLLQPSFRAVVQRAALGRGDAHTGLIDRAVHELDAVPERERERRRRVARLETARLDESHPPTGLRIELLERRGARSPLVVLDEQGSRAIDEELRPRRSPIEHRIVDLHRDSLYRR